MLVKVNVSLEEKTWKTIDAFAKKWNVSRSKACRRLFDDGIKEFRKKMSKSVMASA